MGGGGGWGDRTVLMRVTPVPENINHVIAAEWDDKVELRRDFYEKCPSRLL